LAKELRAQGAYIASPTVLKWYCISCAIHFKILKIRSEDSRRQRGKLR
jgi:small subunit ribosomal protein S26e